MGTQTTSGPGLARRRLGVVHIFFFTVAASAPLTVLGGGVTTTFAVTGVVGAPLAFLVVGAALGLFAVGYAAMSRFVSNAGAFYSYIAHGLGRAWGVSGAFVALVAYNAIQIGLYGLFGAVLGDFMNSEFGVDLSWWIWAFVAMALIAILGVLRVDLNATVLAVLLVLEVIVVVIFDTGAFTKPAGGSISSAGLEPANLFGGVSFDMLGIVFALSIAAFAGFESAALYSEECKDPKRTVARATYAALAFTSIFYALSAWALTVGTGPAEVAQQSQENGPGVLFGLLAEHWGGTVATIANALFITSIFAALLSFHNGVARYLFALGREQVLPAFLGRTGIGSGAPVAGSLVQTVIAFVVTLGFVAFSADPVIQLFTWLSTLSAAGILLLMGMTSLAVIGFFNGRPDDANPWQRLVAPALASVALFVMFGLTMYHFGTLVGAAGDTAYLRWLLPGLVVAGLVAGLVWGVILRNTRPAAYEQIGRGALAPIDDGSPELSRSF